MTDAEAPVFWSSYANGQLIGKVPDAGKHWRQKAKKLSEDETAGWHHRCNGHELGQTSGDGEGRGLACCSPWDLKESDMTRWLNNKGKDLCSKYELSSMWTFRNMTALVKSLDCKWGRCAWATVTLVRPVLYEKRKPHTARGDKADFLELVAPTVHFPSAIQRNTLGSLGEPLSAWNSFTMSIGKSQYLSWCFKLHFHTLLLSCK